MLLLALTGGDSLGRHYIAMFEATQNVTLKPTETWREALLDTRVMDLFFTVSIPSMLDLCFSSQSSTSFSKLYFILIYFEVFDAEFEP